MPSQKTFQRPLYSETVQVNHISIDSRNSFISNETHNIDPETLSGGEERLDRGGSGSSNP